MVTQRSNGSALATLATALVALLLLYVAAYLVMVRSKPLGSYYGIGPWNRQPAYRFGGRTAERLFFPIQVIDKRIRSDYWTDEDFEPFEPVH